MRIKKILSLTVVLAMVMAVVPMFGITAGAADDTVTLEVKPGLIDKVVNIGDIKFNGDRASFPSVGGSAESVSAYTGWKAYYYDTENNELDLNDEKWFEQPSNQAQGGLQKYSKKAANEETATEKNYLKFQGTANKGGDGDNKDQLKKDQNVKITTPGYGSEKESLDGTYIAIEWVRQHNYGNQSAFYYRFKFYDKDDKEFASFLFDKNDSSAFTGIKSPDEPEPLQRIVVINGSDTSNPTHTVYYQENTGDGYVTVEKMTTSGEGFVNGFKTLKEFSQQYNIAWALVALGDFKVYAGEIPYVDVNTKYVAGDVNLGSKTIRGIEGDTIDFVNNEEYAPSIIQHTDGNIYIKSENADLSSYTIKSSQNDVSVQYTKETLTVDDIELTTRVGVAAKLSKTVTAKGAASEKDYPGLEVNWTTNAGKVPTDTTAYKVEGTLKDYSNVTVTANVTVKETVEDEAFLVAHYSFEGDAEKGKNSAPNAEKYAATVGDKIEIREAGPHGKAAYMPGDGNGYADADVISINDNLFSDERFKTSKAFTVSAYVNKDLSRDDWARLYDFGVGDKETSDGTKGDIYFAINNANSGWNLFQCEGSISGETIKADNVSVTPKVWHHVATTLEKVNDTDWHAVVYQDGEISREVDVKNAKDFTEIANLDASQLKYYIGASNWGDNLYSGYIDEFKVYSVALTQDEIAKLQFEETNYEFKDNFDEISILSGSSLPTQFDVTGEYGSKKTENVVWEEADLTTVTDAPITVNGKIGNTPVSVKVNVLPSSYALEGMSANRTRIDLPNNITGKFYVEFDLVIDAIDDYSVQFGKNGGRWGNADSGFGIGTNNHKINVTGGDGTDTSTDSDNGKKFVSGGGRDILEGVSTGETYRVLVKGDASVTNGEVTVTVISHDGTVKTSPAICFRDERLKEINSIDVCGAGKPNDGIKISNVRVYDPNALPSKPVATLGYDDGEFTIDFTYGIIPGKTIKVVDGDNTIGEAPETAEKGVTLKTKATNRNYTPVAVDGDKETKGDAVSVYELIVKAVAAETGDMKADKLAAANKVIAEGGILSTDTLDEVRSEIMEKNDSSENSVMIKQTIFDKGIGFTVGSGKIYVGSEVEATASAVGEGNGVYQYMKIDEEAKTVTLSNDPAFAQDAVILSLDSVNIEFVETIIEEAGADGADADVALIPEL